MEHSTPHTDGTGAQGSQGPSPQESGARRPEAGHQLFSWIRSTGITRPDSGWAGGVMAALASRLGWDAALVRGLGVVALILFFSPTALLYGLVWILVPNTRGEIHLQEAMRGNWTAGVFGGGLLALVGGLNVFTPVSLAGPFAVLVNLAVLGAVAWAVWALVRRHRREKTQGGAARSAPYGPTSPEAGGQGDSAGKARAGSSSSAKDERPGAPRTDGRPAWFPKDSTGSTDEADSPAHAASPQSRPSAATTSTTGAVPRPSAPMTQMPAPAERAAQRRRGLVTLGLVLLAIPLLLGAVWLAGQLGAPLFTGLLVGLAGAVVVLAVWHIISAARGRKGRGGLLTTAVVLMLVVFAAQSASGFGGSHHVFGSYMTSETQVNTGFADTTVDLRSLDFTEEDAADVRGAGSDQPPGPDGPFPHTAEINNAFGNTTVILPDDVYWQVDPGNFLGNVEIRTQDVWEADRGIGATTQAHGPEQAVGAVELHLGNAFGNVVIYDETTYQQEEHGVFDGAETDAEEPQRDDHRTSPTAPVPE